MSDQENLDVGKVIGLIMENPQLIEQISNLARQSSPPEGDAEVLQEVEQAKPEEAVSTQAVPTYRQSIGSRGNRAQLLCALKPYVSEERARALDSMISIVDIIDMMKER